MNFRDVCGPRCIFTKSTGIAVRINIAQQDVFQCVFLVQILEKALLPFIFLSELKTCNFLSFFTFKFSTLTTQHDIPCLKMFNLEFEVTVWQRFCTECGTPSGKPFFPSVSATRILGFTLL